MRKFEAIFSPDGELADICTMVDGRRICMLEPAGKERELTILHPHPFSKLSNQLPVLLGSGLGHALDALIKGLEQTNGKDFKLAIVDAEEDILNITSLQERYKAYKNIKWLCNVEADTVLNDLTKWQEEHQNLPFCPIVNSFYLRINRQYYAPLKDALAASARFDFWAKAAYPKFKQVEPRILLITSKYFLIGELVAACERMGIAYHLLQLPEEEVDLQEFMQQLLTAVVTFKPDFALTINHLGVDREGILQETLAKMKLPLASWFVDNPHLILYSYKHLSSPWLTIFTWDADNIESLHKDGFDNVFYLPLGTDHTRFTPSLNTEKLATVHPEWSAAVSFVGNSMLHKVAKRFEFARLDTKLASSYKDVAADFAESDERSVYGFLQSRYPQLLPSFHALQSTERKLSYEAMLTWEATLQYRLECVKSTLPYAPLIVGDDGWFTLLKGENSKWRYHSELTYYTDLPVFYPLSAVNFNCTSKQMKGAVNQRIFDVPAAGAFILTDWREQIANLFEPGKEVICYHSPEEATELIAYYLRHPEKRKAIAQAALKRVLADHKYESRINTIVAHMRTIYS